VPSNTQKSSVGKKSIQQREDKKRPAQNKATPSSKKNLQREQPVDSQEKL
jgi:hypothetical protein